MKIAPSILAGDLANLSSVLAELEDSGCDLVHFDVMDGHFVPNLTFGPPLIREARKYSKLPFDVHMMVTDPAAWVPQLSDLGIDILSFQIEATRFAHRLITLIRDHGMNPSVALNPQTPLTMIEEVLPLIDNVLIMSVDPGFAGQSFISAVYNKIEKLIDYREQEQLLFTVQVDGGVNEQNANELAGLGVEIVVAGNAYFKAADRGAFVELIHSA